MLYQTNNYVEETKWNENFAVEIVLIYFNTYSFVSKQ